MRSLKQHAVLAAMVIGMASALACSSESGTYVNPGVEEGETGVVGMQLQIAPGVTVNTVSWTITNATTGFSKSGTVNVQFSNVIKFQVGGLPSGAGYTITLNATSVDGTISCTGSTGFTVVPGATSQVNLTLVCTGAAPDAGTIVVNGATQVCANINSLSVFPLETTVDSTISLAATASAGSVTPTYAWTATAGTFDNAASATPVFTCPSTPAVVTITLTVSPSAPVCTTITSQSVDVTCDTLNPTFTNVYANVIGARCTGCHRPGGSGVNVGMLDMSTPAVAYSSLVGVPGAGTGAGTSGVTCGSLMPPMIRVAPNDSANSLLYNKVASKLAGTLAACGSPMPLPATGAPLRAGQVALIKDWIDSGAHND
jgi:hypothetical protein